VCVFTFGMPGKGSEGNDEGITGKQWGWHGRAEVVRACWYTYKPHIASAGYNIFIILHQHFVCNPYALGTCLLIINLYRRLVHF